MRSLSPRDRERFVEAILSSSTEDTLVPHGLVLMAGGVSPSTGTFQPPSEPNAVGSFNTTLHTTTAMKSLLLLSLASALSMAAAFHEPIAGGNSLASWSTRLHGNDNPPRQSSLQSASTHCAVATTTSLFASRQFRNVEEMLDSFQEELVLINFMAVNCGPCRLQKKELAAVSQLVGPDELHMLAIDTNRWPNVSSRFDVGKLPCLVAMKRGQVVFRLEGYTKAEDVVAHVRSVQEQPQYQ